MGFELTFIFWHQHSYVKHSNYLYHGTYIDSSSAAPPLNWEECLATVANILGQDDFSFCSAGIPIRLYSRSTAYLTWLCHVFRTFTWLQDLFLGKSFDIESCEKPGKRKVCCILSIWLNQTRCLVSDTVRSKSLWFWLLSPVCDDLEAMLRSSCTDKELSILLLYN